LWAQLVYGEEPSWEDPVKFSFAYGDKDRVPYPVDRQALDESIQMLRQSVELPELEIKKNCCHCESLDDICLINEKFLIQI